MFLLKLAAILIIFCVTIAAGYLPFSKRDASNRRVSYPAGESLACGIFLGAALLHMLADANESFADAGITYPIAFLFAGWAFLVFLWMEHAGREIYQHDGDRSNAFAVLATVMLAIHSFFAGAALGLISDYTVAAVIFVAILAHKWAASFALSVQINKSDFSKRTRILLFLIFALMVPAGILCGSATKVMFAHYPLIEPIFASVAAGTFLYLGTLHGLEKATLIKQCCDLRRYTFVILGFAIMATVAIWT